MKVPPRARRKTKTPFRRDAVIAHIRDLIVSGRLQPGERLPTRAEIADRCSAPPLTVQDAFDRLVADGFVTVEGRKGSFVAARLPHRERLVIAFPEHPGGSNWGEFWARVDQVVRRLTDERKLWLDICYDVERGLPGEQRLSQEVLDHRVAGILFAASPHVVNGTPTLEAPGPVRAAMMGGEGAGSVLPVQFDIRSVYERVVDHLAEVGVRRPAFIIPSPNYHSFGGWLHRRLAQRGLAADRHLVQLAGARGTAEVEQLLHLFLALPKGRRPDALVVGDDNLLGAALRGLGQVGVEPGPGFRIVVQANFPVIKGAHPGVSHIGFSIPEIIGAALDLIQDRIAGGQRRLGRFLAYREDEVDDLGRPLQIGPQR